MFTNHSMLNIVYTSWLGYEIYVYESFDVKYRVNTSWLVYEIYVYESFDVKYSRFKLVKL
jgi:hypothetical protein